MRAVEYLDRLRLLLLDAETRVDRRFVFVDEHESPIRTGREAGSVLFGWQLPLSPRPEAIVQLDDVNVNEGTGAEISGAVPRRENPQASTTDLVSPQPLGAAVRDTVLIEAAWSADTVPGSSGLHAAQKLTRPLAGTWPVSADGP